MLKQTFKYIDSALAAILAMVFGVLLGVYAWLSYEPREVTNQLPEYLVGINEVLAQKGYQLTLDKALISNDGFANPLLLRVTDVRLANRQNRVLAHIPELNLSPSLVGILRGQPYSANIEVVGAEFSILQDAQGNHYLDTQEEVKPLRLDTLFFSAEKDKATQQPEKDFSFDELFKQGVQKIRISDAKARYSSELRGFDIDISSLSIGLNSVLETEQINGNLAAAYINSNGQKTLLQTDIIYSHNSKNVDVKLNMHQFIPSQFAKIDNNLAKLAVLPFSLSGVASGGFNLETHAIDNLEFAVKSDNLVELSAKGMVHGTGDNLHVVAKGTMGEFDLPFLKKHWPEGIGSDAYRWIDESLRSAKVSKADFDINLTLGTLTQNPLPQDSVIVVLHVEDAVIDYVPGFPNIKQADGRVIFEGQSLLAEIDHIKMLSGTRMQPMDTLSKATVKIPDLLLDNIQILIDVPLKAPLSDVIRFTEATPYKLPPNLPFKASGIGGLMEGVLSMQVLDRVSPIEDEVDFQLDTKLKNIGYTGLVTGVDLSNLYGSLEANNDTVASRFSGKFNDQKFNGEVSIQGGAERYNYKGYLPVAVVTMFAKDLEPYLNGALMVNANMTRKAGGSSNVDMDIDTRNMSYNIPQLGARKNIGSTGSINVIGSMSDSKISLSQLQIKDSNINFSGSLGMSTRSGIITSSRIDYAQIGRTQVKGNYYLKEGKHHLKLTSSMVDLEALGNGKKESDKSLLQQLADIPDIEADITVEKIRFSKDQELQNLLLKADCVSQRCSQFEFSANAGKTPITAKIGQVGGKRNFTAQTPDLGRVLRTTGAFDDLRNGALQINAVYQDDQPNRPMAGRVIVENFNAKNIPILAKLLTVATFTGILDGLSGGGISFTKMEVPFKYNREKLIIEKAKAVGPSIGITASGAIDIVPDEMSIDGVLIPAKLFDTILSDIPLIGNVYQAITGGEGLVAVNYSMKGKMDDPKVRVNPLSALTPGFLRGVFGMGGGESTQEIQDAKDAKEAIQAVENELKEMENEAAEEAAEEAVIPEEEASKEVENEELLDEEDEPENSENEATPNFESILEKPIEPVKTPNPAKSD